MLWCRCLYCDAGFMSEHDDDVCPKCEERERRQHQHDGPGPDVSSPWKQSRPVMRERLSVSGDRDE